MKIEQFIADCRFTPCECEIATTGDCMWFAIALQDVLQEHSVTVDLMACAYGPRVVQFNWGHIIVAQKRTYYDIRGRVLLGDLRREFHSDRIVTITRDRIINVMQTWHPLLPFEKRIAKWDRRIRHHLPVQKSLDFEAELCQRVPHELPS